MTIVLNTTIAGRHHAHRLSAGSCSDVVLSVVEQVELELGLVPQRLLARHSAHVACGVHAVPVVEGSLQEARRNLLSL